MIKIIAIVSYDKRLPVISNELLIRKHVSLVLRNYATASAANTFVCESFSIAALKLFDLVNKNVHKHSRFI